jgi:hypothetical protein
LLADSLLVCRYLPFITPCSKDIYLDEAYSIRQTFRGILTITSHTYFGYSSEHFVYKAKLFELVSTFSGYSILGIEGLNVCSLAIKPNCLFPADKVTLAACPTEFRKRFLSKSQAWINCFHISVVLEQF